MVEFQRISEDVDERVDFAIENSMKIYLYKLSYGMIYDGLEASFQCYLFDILQKELEKIRIFQDEYFTVIPEFTIRLNKKNDEIDIAINYTKQDVLKKWLIELKYKKESQSAHNIGVIQSFEDIKDLEEHKVNCENNIRNYFYFLTDCKTYSNPPRRGRGTRAELPMYDNAVLNAGEKYMATGTAAVECIQKTHYTKGFVFENTFKIEYNHISSSNGKEYWYYSLKI